MFLFYFLSSSCYSRLFVVKNEAQKLTEAPARTHTHTCTLIVRLFIEFNLNIYYTLSKLMLKFLLFANSFVIRVCFYVFTYFEFPPLRNYRKKCLVTFLNVNLINNERSHEQFNISMLWSITNP